MWWYFIALIAGAILPLAFAPFNIYFFGFLSPAVLLYIWLRSSPARSFLVGLLFGIGFFTVGTYWIYISINTYGNTPVPISIIVTALFILVLTSYIAFQGYFFNKFFQHKSIAIKSLCVFPCFWVIFEWLRGILFTGFPWLFLGYSQLNNPLEGLAPIIGVYGLSWVVAFISGCLVVIVTYNPKKIKSFAIISVFTIIIVSWLLTLAQWTKPYDKPLQVSLVQGNISQQMKWSPAKLTSILNTYQELTEQHWKSSLIVWPEAAVPIFPQEVSSYLNNLNQAAKKHHVSMILGAPIINPKTKQYYNGMLLLGDSQGIYLKRHLVPFGEFLPLKSLFSWFIKRFNVPMSDFSSGPAKQMNLRINHFFFAPFICYEIAYPNLVLDSMNNKHLIVVITDDSWFGQSIALNQQVQMGQMRALETGRYLLHSTNTGITAIINAKGRIIAQAPIGKKYVLTGMITPMSGKTPLMWWHYYPIIVLIVVLLLFSIISKRHDQ